ncbi:hypothetical protein JXA56_04840 [Candidatus Micrarchaeota archaeon]|nr:hypothetical protein [Candidatus Micrarchaeota archaeon]
MFGTSGIRGIYGQEITEELAAKIGNVFAKDVLFLGRDLRTSGISLADAVAEGAQLAGCDVVELGIVPTPTVAYAGKRGIMVTASHNPPEYNGLKLMEDSAEIDRELEKKVTEDYRKPARIAEKGAITKNNEILYCHRQEIVNSVSIKKRPKIVIDCNGAAAALTPFLLGDLGCRVISLNSSLGCFNRPSEPNRESLRHLGRLVVEFEADFGVAHDGDGDRCVIVDDKGEMLPFDVQLAMMIEHELAGSSNKKIVSTVEASLAIRKVVEENGGIIEITPVGSTYVGSMMRKINALFGGEPCGEYIYNDGVHVPDAPMAVAKFAEIFENGKFSEQRKKYRHGFMAREKFGTKDKRETVERVKRKISIKGKIRDDDGIRVDEEDGWFLIRASGTEPVVRLTMEYESREKLAKRKEELIRLILE